MRKDLTITSIAGVTLVMLASAVSAAQHPAFDGWRVDGGTIIGTDGDICGATSEYECSIIADGDGFVQRQVSLRGGSSNESFIQTIVTDQTATGAPGDGLGFYDVTFVKMSMNLGAGANTTQNGIAGEQVIADTTSGAGQSFESITTITTGWAQEAPAAGGISAPITISQSLEDMGDPATQGDDFISNFTYDASLNAEGVRDGFDLTLDQTVGLAANGGSPTDVQVFAFRQLQGTLNPTANGTGVSVGADSMTWAAGDDIKAIWLGQEVDLSSVSGTGGGGTGVGSMMGSAFGYVAFQNVTAGGDAITEFGFGGKNSSDAWIWDTASFGDIPCLRQDAAGVCAP